MLIIHPKDRTTDFLKPIYDGLDATVVTGGKTKFELMQMIREHDQVMMMGHGTPHGLLGSGQFPGYGSIIDDTFADVLSEKDNSVFIWCNADQYVAWNNLKGFYTGMFVSEVSEARCMGLPWTVNQNHVDESNESFVDHVSNVSGDSPEVMHAFVKHAYGEEAWRNPVVKYNHERLYVQ